VAAFRPTAVENLAAVFGSHACAESVRVFSLAAMRLVCSLHCAFSFCSFTLLRFLQFLAYRCDTIYKKTSRLTSFLTSVVGGLLLNFFCVHHSVFIGIVVVLRDKNFLSRNFLAEISHAWFVL